MLSIGRGSGGKEDSAEGEEGRKMGSQPEPTGRGQAFVLACLSATAHGLSQGPGGDLSGRSFHGLRGRFCKRG